MYIIFFFFSTKLKKISDKLQVPWKHFNFKANIVTYHASAIQPYGWKNPTSIQWYLAVLTAYYSITSSIVNFSQPHLTRKSFVVDVFLIKYFQLYLLCNSKRNRKGKGHVQIGMVLKLCFWETTLTSYLVTDDYI